MKKIHAVYGAVAIVDALGARTFTIDQAKDFLKSRRRIEASVRQSHELGDWLGRQRQNGDAELDLQVRTFGDTVVLAWTFKEAEILRAGHTVHHALAAMVAGSFDDRIAWRGSVAIGEYVIDQTSVLGPAVSDAAAWYEALDWVGIVATPRTKEILTGVAKPDERWFIDYEIPYSGSGGSAKLTAVNWPEVLLQSWLGIESDDADKPPSVDIASDLEPPSTSECRSKLAALFSRFAITFGTEKKFENTRAFFEHCLPGNVGEVKALQERLRKAKQHPGETLAETTTNGR